MAFREARRASLHGGRAACRGHCSAVTVCEKGFGAAALEISWASCGNAGGLLTEMALLGRRSLSKPVACRQFDPDAKGHVPAQQPQHTDSYVQHLEQLLREQSATAQQAAAELDRREAFVPPAEASGDTVLKASVVLRRSACKCGLSLTATLAGEQIRRSETCTWRWQDAMQLDSEGAEAFAVLLRIMRSPDTSGTTLAECRAMKPADLLSIYKARTQN